MLYNFINYISETVLLYSVNYLWQTPPQQGIYTNQKENVNYALRLHCVLLFCWFCLVSNGYYSVLNIGY